jgi:hypothetical protein
MNSVKIVEEFWERVWKACNPAAIDDFVITTDAAWLTGERISASAGLH